ncbi:Co2+/Mg2+ efflux protein ApaG [Thalassotalea sp. LPB0316]|uniref:Co2+/Mg2+ efflux protein ApaG n=1 Tax=Thalassotalea sp. LPB0316 TaxID=2769490 RepID=UPI001865EBBE|nr:Co2+/Mg2+ efflux protein ApaG [Thalassotalea sp. LPB0316]QOL26640.1 Co2+/Mg2+ efflux protein ApaG [Thalassotalea sp. LPB0316]
METTQSISVQVETRFMPEQSLIDDQRYMFTYTITITNNGEQSAQLLSRSWLITDSIGETSTVEGDGVVGQQPILQPQQTYTYTSGCILKSPMGTMEGFYIFVQQDGKQVKAPIKVFTLAMPNIIN